jgi:ferric-dicitrate binding protein FerR (iron transport regulator)
MTVPSGRAELERLLNASVDGELTDADEASLQALLRDDPAARRRYLQFMQLHAELHWDHGAAAALLASPEDESGSQRVAAQPLGRQTRLRRMLAIVAGVIAAGCLLAVVLFNSREAADLATQPAPVIARMEMTQGAVSFRTSRGETLIPGSSREALPAGVLVSEGESSAAQWRFLDGTLVTLSGDTEISFSDDAQKVLRVRRGTLTAEVKPQPPDAPLVVETPTARVEVLGTIFTLAAEPERTRINVAEGRVRLKRLVDGETVEVPGEHSCVASLDARGKLQPEVPDRPAVGWQHHFQAPPPERWKGEWRPPEGKLPGRLRAVACLVGRKHKPDGAPIVHYGITARKGEGEDLGSLPPDGVVRIRFRLERSAKLQLILGLNRADGGFGGNFEAKLPRDAGTPLADGWSELTVPLADFHPIVERKREMPVDARPYLILITTFGDEAGLEVSEVAIEDGQTSEAR